MFFRNIDVSIVSDRMEFLIAITPMKRFCIILLVADGAASLICFSGDKEHSVASTLFQ